MFSIANCIKESMGSQVTTEIYLVMMTDGMKGAIKRFRVTDGI